MSNDYPEMPPIPQLTQAQLNRLICADYLEALAKFIRTGKTDGFDIAWDTRYNKPLGTVQMSAVTLQGPLETKMKADIAEEQRKAEQQIPVQDLSEEIRDHQCENPNCLACSNRKNELKS